MARRPGVGPRVVEAILDRGEPSVLAALAGNTETDLSDEALRRLVFASRRITALRSPLVRHPQLTRPLALQMYSWIGEALRSALADRFEVDPEDLCQAVGDAVATAHAGPAHRPAPAGAEQDEMERRLVAKLEAARELRPGVPCARSRRASSACSRRPWRRSDASRSARCAAPATPPIRS